MYINMDMRLGDVAIGSYSYSVEGSDSLSQICIYIYIHCSTVINSTESFW